MKKLVIFDLDGTLLNTLGDLAASCNYLMEQHGYPTHPLDRYRYLVGNGINKLIERAKEALLSSGKTMSEIAYSLGFQYPQHLSRMFKRVVGYTPQEFRHGLSC